jgi:hypothetical protein
MRPGLNRLLPFVCCAALGIGGGAAVESEGDFIGSDGPVADAVPPQPKPLRAPVSAGPGLGPSDQRMPIPEPLPVDPDEVLWRQVILEDGRVVVIRGRLAPATGAKLLRDAFIIKQDQVVDRTPLNPDDDVLHQVRMLSRVQPLTGLVPAESFHVMTAMEFMDRPPLDLPPQVVENLGGAEGTLYWHQVVIAEGRVMIFWDRLTEGGQSVRDGFLIDRQEVVSHMFLDAGADAVQQADIFAADVFGGDATNLGPLEPAAEGNVLIVADYLDDFGGQGNGQLGGDFALKAFVSQQPTTEPGTDPGTDPPPVSPSGGIGGF